MIKSQKKYLDNYILSFLDIEVISYFFRDYLLCLLSNNKIKVPPIIFIRKKVYPDMGEYSYLSKKLNKDTRNILGIYPFTGRKDQKFGYYYISSIKGMALRFSKYFFQRFIACLKILIFL